MKEEYIKSKVNVPTNVFFRDFGEDSDACIICIDAVMWLYKEYSIF